MKENNELDGLYARLDDIAKRAARGDMGISAFLSPRELHYAERFLALRGISFLSCGGYEQAERQRIYILPDYMEELSSMNELSAFGYSDGIAVIEARGSGFEKLSHRTFMGALLGLGIERDVVGDIVMISDNTALVFCDEGIAGFLLSHWERAGRDKIKLSKTCVPKDFLPARKVLAVSDTVASPRIDCIVAAVCSLSREKARATIESGFVELDYETELRADREVCAPCILSVRGFGKFRILSVSDKTKKGRFRLLGEKFL